MIECQLVGTIDGFEMPILGSVPFTSKAFAVRIVLVRFLCGTWTRILLPFSFS
jgi:hypothetical protein